MISSRRRLYTILLVLSVCIVTFCILCLDNKPEFINEEVKNYLICSKLLKNLSSSGLRGMVIDLNFLEKCQQSQTGSVDALKIAVLNGTTIDSSLTNNLFDIIYYSDYPAKDYWIFYDKGVKRAVPRMSLKKMHNFDLPENFTLFKEYWDRSRMLECKNINMKRKDKKRSLPIPYSFEQMALLRDLLVSYGMVPYLQGGSLLGWYRECSIIPHTPDMDFMVSIEQFNPQFEIDVREEKTKFKLYRKLGMVNDSLEYTIKPKYGKSFFFIFKEKDVQIDVFFIYKEQDEYWIGMTGTDGKKFRNYYPVTSFIPKCSADLGGHLFWVTCEPDEMLNADYGKDWRLDHPTAKFGWHSSGKNVKEVGQWPMEKLNEVHQTF